MLFKRLIKNKLFIISLVVIIAIVLVFLGAKIYLLFSFFIGNDTIIKVGVDNEYLFLQNGETGNVELEAKVTTNPFCSATCSVELINLGNLNVVDYDDVSLKPSKPFTKSYNLLSKNTGIGKDFYRFNVECVSSGGYLCHSDKEITTRNLLVTVEHDLNDVQKSNKEKFEEEAQRIYDEINLLKGELFVLNDFVLKFNSSISLKYDLNFDLGNFSSELKNLSSNELYYDKLDELNMLDEKIIVVSSKIYEINKSIVEVASIYNKLIDDLLFSRSFLVNITSVEFESMGNVLLFIDEFNSIVNTFGKKDNIENKSFLINGFVNRLLDSNFSVVNGTLIDKTIPDIDFEKIFLFDLPFELEKLEFAKLVAKCSINNIVDECDVLGKNDLVFLHGHAVTRDASLEYSLEGFNLLQKELDNEEYLSVGAITLYTNKNIPFGIWNTFAPFSIRASYYFDLFEEPDNYRVVLTKSENIDTYAVRMKEVFDNIRFRNGKKKIDVIAFSMGGLVMRRHMQLFGSDGFGKVILIGTPNKGVIGDVATLCPLVGGEKRECEDLTLGSLFLQKLNREKVPENVYNIYGIGCNMNGGKGDGIVLEKNAKLEGIENFVINGNCKNKFQPLHLDLLKSKEVFDIVRDILDHE
jgi:hypothetical protein